MYGFQEITEDYGFSKSFKNLENVTRLMFKLLTTFNIQNVIFFQARE